jgi:hypothetical protein
VTRAGIRALAAGLLLAWSGSAVAGPIQPGASSPSSVRALVANSAACSTSVWHVNPSSGSDTASGTTSGTALKTAQQLAQRRAGCAVISQVTVYVHGTLNTGDWATFPSIGPTGYEVWSCDGAATVLRTGTLTGAGAVSGNTAAFVQDSSANFSTACNGGSCAGYRIRITSGARVGAIAWIGYVVSNTEVRTSGFTIDPWIATPTTRPAPGYASLTTASVQGGDPYVIEQLASLGNAPMFDTISADQSNIDTSRLVVAGCALSTVVQYPTYGTGVVDAPAAVPFNGSVDSVAFVGSYSGFVTGGVHYEALFDDYWQSNGTTPTYVYDSVILGDAALNGASIYGASLLQENCGAPCQYAGGSSSVETGSAWIDGLVVAGGSAITVEPGASLSVKGSGNLAGWETGGICVHVQTGASLTTNQASYACGDAGAVNLAGTTYVWAQVQDAGAVTSRGATFGGVN